LHLVGILFPHINDDARSKSHQTSAYYYTHSHIHAYTHRQYVINCLGYTVGNLVQQITLNTFI